MPRLDGLRAVAVSSVLVSHYWQSPLLDRIGPGGAGVRIFFVLSGYLITRILLGYQNDNWPTWEAAVHFYWRRFLRLTPALWLAIAVASALGIMNMREHWWVHAFYLTNFLIAKDGEWITAGHFWSLAVEEQFYVLWFFAVIATRQLIPIAIVSLIISPLFREFAVSVGNTKLALLLPGTMDFLMAGALLAYAEINNVWSNFRRTIASPKITILSLFALAVSSVAWDTYSLPRMIVWYPSVIIFSASIILAISMNEKNPLVNWLDFRPIRYIGKISYGIYVYHGFVVAIALIVFPNLNSMLHGVIGHLLRLIFIAASLLAAHLSWIFIEYPLRSLRRKQFWFINRSSSIKTDVIYTNPIS